jgi:hypothetical protein
MAKFFEIKYPLERPGVKKRWIRIGSATAVDGGGFSCTIEAIPLNWTGEFYIWPTRSAEQPNFVPDACPHTDQKGRLCGDCGQIIG